MQALADRAGAVLRAQGERMTEPRRAVLTALAGRREHLSVDQVVAEVAEVAPAVHRASVYRALDALSRVGLVRHVHLGRNATAYHLVDPGAEQHLHARCQDCGAVLDLPGGLLDEVAARLEAEHGFALDPAHVALSGRCAACRARGDARGGRAGGSAEE